MVTMAKIAGQRWRSIHEHHSNIKVVIRITTTFYRYDCDGNNNNDDTQKRERELHNTPLGVKSMVTARHFSRTRQSPVATRFGRCYNDNNTWIRLTARRSTLD